MLKKIFTKAVLKKTNSLNEAIKNLSKTGLQICFICDGKKINRYNYRWRYKKSYFKKKNLETQIKEVMNKKLYIYSKKFFNKKSKNIDETL